MNQPREVDSEDLCRRGTKFWIALYNLKFAYDTFENEIIYSAILRINDLVLNVLFFNKGIEGNSLKFFHRSQSWTMFHED